MDGPLCSDYFCIVIILAFIQRCRQVLWQADTEQLGQYGKLVFQVDRLDTGNNRHIDPDSPALVDKIIVELVIKKHLGDNIIRSIINLLFEIGEVGCKIGSLKMFFRIARDTNAEIERGVVLQICFQISPLA